MLQRIFVLAALVAAAASVKGAPTPSLTIQCDVQGFAGALSLYEESNGQSFGLDTDGTTLIVADNPKGNIHLQAQFDSCKSKYMNYKSGTSLNSGGSMGAGLNYFGHVRVGKTECLTAQKDGRGNTWSSFKVASCSDSDDATQLAQWFVYTPNGPNTAQISFVGTKNDTQTPWSGEMQFWYPGVEEPNHSTSHRLEVTAGKRPGYDLHLSSDNSHHI